MRRSSTIYILTSFVMKSGVAVLREALLEAAERGADIKICTGDYLYITQPDALSDLLSIHESIEVKLFQSGGVSFHPKSYILDAGDGGVLFVGSSNLSRSALQHGVEWNLAMQKSVEPSTFDEAIEEFSKLFHHENTVVVNTETVRLYREQYDAYHAKQGDFVRSWTEAEELDFMLPAEQQPTQEMVTDHRLPYAISPRFAQVEALQELETALEEGYDKALVVMATGLGKTYLAAFFARHFRRVLFVAHREEILYQAQQSFHNVHHEKTTGIYCGRVKEPDADFVFASVATLNQKRHLMQFDPQAFDLVVIDEFHHAAASSYQSILRHFEPRFLLGITATPYRNDNRDIFALCDGKVAYKIDFIEAIQQKWLAPFHYYGVYDDTDYTKIRWVGTKYDQDELAAAQNRRELYEKTLEAWRKHKQTRTIVFCSSVRQAEALNAFFQENGHKTIALHANTKDISRPDAIRQLGDGELEAIFTVDLFNEGTDIPAVDTLLFVRPTESLTVFTQQVGRGLRLHEGKDYCVIIDLIGNYRNADVKMSLFQVDMPSQKGQHPAETVVPDGCEIHFETQAIDLLAEMAKKKMPRRELLRDNYFTVKTDLGRRPSYLELYQHGAVAYEMYRQEFKSYVGFLEWAEELTLEEREAFELYRPWLEEIEKTGMTKSYKMVVLSAMLERGPERWFAPTTPEEVAPYFHQYYMSKKYRKDKDFSSTNTKKMWDYNEKQVSKLIADMPMSKFSTNKDLISFTNNELRLHFNLLPEHRELLWRWTKEIAEYRLHYYFFHRGINLH
ncbi:DEAD/DEAH box helicase family protein [Ectobacillus sp. JY-23]|uniref:DEAD/DEAH box helicase family protein n=1 Tax=Ectobacillus sp. JY-23 TaxID=2933872 RepID=UPI001FF6AB18|nr:DEAD/DEAH box helicase family protein [Ectobacillus sp. JY-23]UOY94599.1 DEAD/DEAH box helicase family protein [Ectobacillus sp. JY-23]